MISAKTAFDIAIAHQEIENAEKLLADINEAIETEGRAHGGQKEIRDVFGARRYGLELGVPSGGNGRRLFNVPWRLARPVIEAHIANQRAEIQALNEKARIELNGDTLPVKTPLAENSDG